MAKSLGIGEKPLKGKAMTPVGIVAILLGLAAAYQIAMRGPAFLAAVIAVGVAVVLQTLAARTAKAIVAARDSRPADPWGRQSRGDRRLLARGMDLTMSLTSLTSLYPAQSRRGLSIAQGLRLA